MALFSGDCEILIMEPYYGGSHKHLIDVVTHWIGTRIEYCLVTLPAKKWHWRARTSALYMSQTVPKCNKFKVLFASSVLNLAELIALRPDLRSLKKILYFHENQLVYPVQNVKDRDFQYGYNQIISCLVADCIVFNSEYNKNSFLNTISKFFKLQPDYRPSSVKESIEEKCQVLYIPMKVPGLPIRVRDDSILYIVWPHRWEHDKNPERFFKVIFSLHDAGYNFYLSVLGETFKEKPPIFKEAYQRLSQKIQHWGFIPSKEDYYKILALSHVAVSTSDHEFYGMSMLEATHSGCFPLCPNALVYPEIYPECCLYDSDSQLYEVLAGFCLDPSSATVMRQNMKFKSKQYDAKTLLPIYEDLLSNVNVSNSNEEL